MAPFNTRPEGVEVLPTAAPLARKKTATQGGGSAAQTRNPQMTLI
jgi:hypothetical protein